MNKAERTCIIGCITKPNGNLFIHQLELDQMEVKRGDLKNLKSTNKGTMSIQINNVHNAACVGTLVVMEKEQRFSDLVS